MPRVPSVLVTRPRRGLRPRAAPAAASIAVAVATLAGMSGTAAAQPILTERVRVAAGYNTERRPAPTPRFHDPFMSVAPGAVLYWGSKDVLFSLDYTLFLALRYNTGFEVSNFATLTSAFELSPRTQMLVGVAAAHSTLTNLLVLNPTIAGQSGVIPPTANQVVTMRVYENLRHRLTPEVNLFQSAETSLFTTLAPAPPVDTWTSTVGLGADRSWSRDSVGGEVRSSYGLTRAAPPIPDQSFVSVSAGPYWRRDWTPTVSSYANAGASIVMDPTGRGDPVIAPSGRGSVLYTIFPTTVELSVATGFIPNTLSGQLTRSNQVILRATTPISQRHQVLLGASASYAQTTLLDLQNRANDSSFNAVFTDVDVTWQVNPFLQTFARYQFLAQIGDTTAVGFNPSFLRDSVFVGLQLSTRAPGGERGGAPAVPTAFPSRVDGGDQRDSFAPENEDPNTLNARDPGAPPPPASPNAPVNAAPPPTPVERGPSRWIHTTPARPAENVDEQNRTGTQPSRP